MEQTFLSFLVAAKQKTYAAGEAGRVREAVPGSVQLEYSQGDWLYRDVYFGSSLFAGQETVHYKNQPYWSMVYAGRAHSEQAEMLAQAGVLQAALREVSEDMPFRGPLEYIQGEFTYQCRVRGDVGWFTGKETITWQGKNIYTLHFQGGYIA